MTGPSRQGILAGPNSHLWPESSEIWQQGSLGGYPGLLQLRPRRPQPASQVITPSKPQMACLACLGLGL